MAELYIYDDIGPEWAGMVSAAAVIEELNALSGEVTVRINSQGGSVVEAMAIYNALLRRGVDVAIDGLAASAASYVAMAGKTITIAENAMMMIHEPWTITMGDADEHTKTAEILGKYSAQGNAVYAARSGKPLDEVVAASKAETWFTAAEAVDFGLADSVGQPLNIAAQVKPGRFKNTPEQLLVSSKQVRADIARKRRMAELRLRLARHVA